MQSKGTILSIMAVLEFMTVMSFAEQFLSVLQRLIQNRQKRKCFQDTTINAVCRAFATKAEARFVAEKVLSRDEVVRLLIEPATPNRRQRLLDVFEAEVNLSSIALWQDFMPKAEAFINGTVDIQLEVLGTVGEAAATDILGRRIDNLQSLLAELKEPKTTYGEYLALVAAESRENCIARWEAAGLSYELAQELANDISVGAPNATLRSQFEKPVIWLVGEFGIGKSLLIERLFQEAVVDAVQREDAPIPIFLRARDIASDSRRLKDIVDASLSSLKDAKTQTVIIFVDGVDEASRNFADNLKVDVRTIQSVRPGTRVFITSRFLQNLSLSDREQLIGIPRLQEAERLFLMSRIAGQEIGKYHFYSSPSTLKEALERPLFAILMANYLRDRTYRSTLSTGELLSTLVGKSLERASAEIESGLDRLKELAVLSIERDGAVQPREIGSQFEVQSLLNTRLVIERSGAVEFPLPILAQWFAAQSLASGVVHLQRLLDNPSLLEKWRYPLAIFVANNSYEMVVQILGPIVERYPAFASSIISESLVQRAGVLPSPKESGQKIREAMQLWMTGIGSLAELIAPTVDGSKVQSIRVSTYGSTLSYSWYAGTEHNDEVQVWQGGNMGNPFEMLSRDWPNVSYLQEGNQLAWPWRVTLNDLSKSLSDVLQERALPVVTNAHPLWNEAIWKIALKFANKSPLYNQPIRISEEVEKRLMLYESSSSQGKQLIFSDGMDFKTLRQIKFGLGENFYQEVSPPWPGADKPWGEGGHWVWNPYSDEQILVRTQAVYKGALEIYQHLVQTWFSKLSPRFNKYALFPARLVGIVTPPSADPEQSDIGPVMDYYFEPLPDGEQAFVDIKLIGESEERLRSRMVEQEFFQEQRERLINLRPKASNWISLTTSSTSISDVFSQVRPATEIAYEWLWEDLKRVAWVDGNLGRNSRKEKVIFALPEIP